MKSSMTKKQKHDIWVDAMLQNPCTDCRLCKNRRNLVLYRGNPYAELMGIGEAPGREEDIRGFAFVGDAGQKLDQMLQYIKIDPPDQGVYLCNVVKCWPGEGNPNPKPDEVAACLPYLKAQIEIVQPKIIMIIGKVAAAALGFLKNDQAPAKPLLENWLEYEGIPAMFIWHPAYLMRTPTKKPDQAKYLKMIAERLNNQWS